MSGDQMGHLAYLVVLGAAIGFWVFVQNRQSLGKTLQYAAVWGLIFLGAIAAYGLWDDIRQTVVPSQAVTDQGRRIELPRQQDGHYYLLADVNGAPIRFMVDTGATGIVLTRADAQKAGLQPEDMVFLGEAMTANGPVSTATVRLSSLSVGPLTDTDVRAFVNGGDLHKSLLGMSYLQRFDRVEIASGRMVLERF